MGYELLFVFVLMMLNGVFAGAEIAVLSVRKTRLAELLDDRRRGARAVHWLRSEPERFLATVQIGITVVGTTAAAFGGEALANDFARMLAGVPGVGPYAPKVGLAIVVVGISFLEIVVGELVPKSIALRRAESYSLIMGPVLRVMASVAKPAVWLLTRASNAILRLVGDKTSFTEARLSPDELQELVEEAARVGSLDAKTSEIASRALDFRELRAADVMVPRSNFSAIPRGVTAEQMVEALRGRRYARMPVYEYSPDNIVGYVSVRDLVVPALRGEVSVDAVIRPVKFVPASLPATELLRQLQADRAPLVMVVDETGGLTGLVTVEDLVEELVGEILNEHDAAPTPLQREADGSAVVPADVPIRDVNRALGMDLPEPEGYTTLAGLCIHLAKRIPEAGTVLQSEDGSSLEVLDSTPRKVRVVRVRPPVEPSAT